MVGLGERKADGGVTCNWLLKCDAQSEETVLHLTLCTCVAVARVDWSTISLGGLRLTLCMCGGCAC
jgi:hypothetical protein